MNCQEVKELFSDYLDHRITPSQIVLLEEHVKSCPACGQELTQLRAIISMTASLGEIETPPDFIVQVNRKIDGERNPGGVWRRLFEPMKIKLPLEAAALLLVSTLAFYLYHESPEMSQDSLALIGKTVEVPEEQKREKEPAPSSEAPAATPPAAPEVVAEKEMRSRKIEVAALLKQESRETEVAPADVGSAKQGARFGIDAMKASPRAAAAPATLRKGMSAEVAQGTSSPQVLEVVTQDVGGSQRQIKSLVEEFGGKVASERTLEDGLVIALELPQSRQAEFQSAVKQEPGRKQRETSAFWNPTEPAAQSEAPVKGLLQAAGAAPPEEKKSTQEKDEPTVKIELRIRQKR